MSKLAGSVVLAMGVIVASGLAQDPAGWANKLIAENGKMMTGHDFGVVPRGAMLQFRFPMTNIYAVPLQITRTSTSCGCVELKPSTNVLQPRETGYIDVTMDTRRFVGPKVVQAYITVGHPQYSSTAVLTISGNCRTDVVVNPGVVTFGVVPVGQKLVKTVDVEYAGVHNWQITGVPSSDLFDVQVQDLYRRPGQVGYKVQVSLKADAPAGSYKQDIALTTNDPAGPTVPIPIDVTVQAPLSARPELHALGTLKAGAEVTRKVIVSGAGKPFRITEVEGQGDGLSIVETMPTNPSPVQTLTIRFQAGAVGTVHRKLNLKTDMDKANIVGVTIDATVVQ